MANRSLIQIYMGNGKGKTTASVGQAIRAAGHRLRVCFAQFLKNTPFPLGERNVLRHLGRNITLLVHEYPRELYDNFTVTNKERLKEEVEHFFDSVEMVIHSGQFEMLVLDELGAVLELGLLDEDRALAALVARPLNLDIVLTGARFPDKFLEAADLVTDFHAKKHHYNQGIIARQGIEF